MSEVLGAGDLAGFLERTPDGGMRGELRDRSGWTWVVEGTVERPGRLAIRAVLGPTPPTFVRRENGTAEGVSAPSEDPGV